MSSNETDNIVEKINDYLLEVENSANKYLPLEDIINPIKGSFDDALRDLKYRADNSDELSDKVFYLHRYADLIKKLESVFDTRSKRLQQTLAMFVKLPESLQNGDLKKDVNNTEDVDEEYNLTPEQANDILKILNNKNKT